MNFNSASGFVVKVLIASTAIAWAIKGLGSRLPLPETSAIALTMVLLPTLLMSVALAWRAQRHLNPDS